MDWLGLEEILNRLAKANEMPWHGHALKRDNKDTLRTFNFKVVGRRCEPQQITRRTEMVKQVGDGTKKGRYH